MSRLFGYSRLCLWLCCSLYGSASWADPAQQAQELQQSFRTMEEALQHSPLKRPVDLSSRESADHLSGDLYASVEYNLSALATAAGSTQHWCEIMLLLSNTKACRTSAGPKNSMQVFVSSSKSADTADATATEFHLDIPGNDKAYFEAVVAAKDGPMGTQDIRMQLQATPLSPTRSFLHLHYSYNTHWLGRVAMQAYLQTLGRGKVGFTPAPDSGAGTPSYIGGARAVIERNTMRYFLGLDCAMALAQQEAPQRFNAMAECWYGQVEKYPLQLHEMQRAEYLQMKAAQYPR
ncbi:MAG: hypothetical protein HXX19_07090 [Rhodoferax sp.]|nr:hypothetical protein [Rhodoferax sp.]